MSGSNELPTERHAKVSYTRGPRHCEGWYRGDFWIVEDGLRTAMYTPEELTVRLNYPGYPVSDYKVLAGGTEG